MGHAVGDVLGEAAGVAVSPPAIIAIIPLAVYLIMGERAKRMLGGWRDWAAQHNVVVMAVLFFVLGLKLIGDGISILTS